MPGERVVAGDRVVAGGRVVGGAGGRVVAGGRVAAGERVVGGAGGRVDTVGDDPAVEAAAVDSVETAVVAAAVGSEVAVDGVCSVEAGVSVPSTGTPDPED